MKNKIITFLTTIHGLIIALPAFAADAGADALKGLGATAGEAGLKTGLASKSVPEIIGSVIGVVLGLLGVVFMILLLYGGYSWMTAYGNEQKLTKAKDTIINATIGLIIILAAYAISRFVIGALVG